MANYQLLKADIDAKVYQNGHQEITGENLNSVLNAMVTTLGAEYQFAGVATIATNPGTPDAKVFYIANGKGTYTNFGGINVTEDEVVVLYWDTAWHKEATGIASQAKLTELESEVSQLGQEANGKIESSVLLAGTRFQPKEIVGYIADNGIINPMSQFHSLITSKIPVKVGDAFSFRGYGNVFAPNAFLYNGDSLVSTQIVTGGTLNVTIPNDITHIVFASYANSNEDVVFGLMQTSPASLQEQIDALTNDLDNRIEEIDEPTIQRQRETTIENPVSPTINMAGGLYDWIYKTIISPEHAEWRYSKFDVSGLSRIYVKGRAYAVSNGYALIAFVDENENAISHLEEQVNEATLDVPANAKYAYVNGIVYYDCVMKEIGVTHTSLIPEIDEIEGKIAAMQLPVICIGDSVTEGMNMDGTGTAEYGKAPYPAQIYTLLKDAGYKQSVINEGISGETTPTMMARCGGMPCIIMNDIALPADTSWVALGNSTTIAACNLYIPIKMLDGVTNYPVYFTGISGVTTPIFIDGNHYNLKVEFANSNYYMSIQKISVANTATKIPAGSLLFTNCSKNPMLSIILGGHNGRSELNFERWSAMMDACLATSANKGIVLGSHINIWHTWNDLIGTTDAEKHADFKTKSTQRFGMRFIDLYDDFFAHALDYCLAAGYFSDKTQAELDAMEATLEQHIVPAEFSYDGQHEGNVHLNREGYYVIAKLVFDRLKAIHYI